MSRNILTVSFDTNGTERTVSYSELAGESGIVGTDDILEYAEQSGAVNLTVTFDDGWKGYDGMRFSIDRARKTVGTYATRLNKLANKIDPSYRERRTGTSSASAKDNVGVRKAGDDTVELFELDSDSYATVSLDGHVETNDFSSMSYWVEAILSPRKWLNRIESLREFVGDVECKPARYAVEFGGKIADLGESEPSDESVAKARAKLGAELMGEGVVFDLGKLYATNAVKVGGESEWLKAFLFEAFPATRTPLPPSAEAESVEAESK